MANRLKMANVQSILSLHERGSSARRIARELGLDRGAVLRHLRLARRGTVDEWSGSKPAIYENGGVNIIAPCLRWFLASRNTEKG